MSTYLFETITPAQALTITSADTLTVGAGSGGQTTILYLADGTISMVVGELSVTFGAAFGALARQGGVTYADGSRLYVGDASANTLNLGSVVARGAAYAGDGDDTMTAGQGDFLLQGNQGNDSLTAYAPANNTVYGGQGNDTIYFQEASGVIPGRNFAQGNKGNDVIQGTSGIDTLLGGQGDDSLYGLGGQDFINGNLGNDVITASGMLLGEGGDDTITAIASAPSNTILGGDGNDFLAASYPSNPDERANNYISGEAGDDRIISRSRGHDELLGGDGNDSIVSSSALDGLGDLIDGGAGNDTIEASDVNHTVGGGAGNDRITLTGVGSSFVDGGDGNDIITAVASSTIDGGSGNDTISGSRNAGGGLGDDSIGGTSAADTLSGGDGADTLSGAAGVDVLFGGSGADLFTFIFGDSGTAPGQLDQIRDWGSDDSLHFARAAGTSTSLAELTAGSFDSAFSQATDLMRSGFDFVAVQIGTDVVVFADTQSSNTPGAGVVLIGRSLADIDSSNIV